MEIKRLFKATIGELEELLTDKRGFSSTVKVVSCDLSDVPQDPNATDTLYYDLVLEVPKELRLANRFSVSIRAIESSIKKYKREIKIIELERGFYTNDINLILKAVDYFKTEPKKYSVRTIEKTENFEHITVEIFGKNSVSLKVLYDESGKPEDITMLYN